jgi:restriction endonuclease S subunit
MMSKKEQDTKTLMSKKSDSAKLKELSKIEGQHINITSEIDVFTLTQALRVKAQMEQLESALKELEKQYQPLRDELLLQVEQVQGSEYDSVEYINEGKRLYKYPKNSKSGKYDERKLAELTKKKKIYSKIFKKVVQVDESELIKSLQSGKISADEFRAISIQMISPVIEIKQVVEQPIETNNDDVSVV